MSEAHKVWMALRQCLPCDQKGQSQININHVGMCVLCHFDCENANNIVKILDKPFKDSFKVMILNVF